ncbi:MAG: divergent polysaccharide deacetylase family protein [Alphaproteobacteria bacterium]|nr:divergent polysaccharide deacetylase family protein [Alphaproteobacteria bacterium]
MSPEQVAQLESTHQRYLQQGAVYEEGLAFARAETPAQPAEPKEENYLPDLPKEQAADTPDDLTYRLASTPNIYPAKSEQYIAPEKPSKPIEIKAEAKTEKPRPPKAQYKYDEPKGKGLVVIIIDDMGLNVKNTREVEDLPGPLTLSYLPYANNLPKQTAYAKGQGHELMVHVPMEPLNGKLDAGPEVLKTNMDKTAFNKALEDDLSQFSGYAGINNHMGSRLTQDPAAMRLVMAALKKRGVYFVDSKTIGTSVAADIAAESGLPYAERDVFLDHEMTSAFVENALRKLEKTAYQKGYAIAIGHPHDVTIAALEKWLPTLKEKGLTLVPASAVVKHVKEPILATAEHQSNHIKTYEATYGPAPHEGLSWEEREGSSEQTLQE